MYTVIDKADAIIAAARAGQCLLCVNGIRKNSGGCYCRCAAGLARSGEQARKEDAFYATSENKE
jgi:hypothetical protein